MAYVPTASSKKDIGKMTVRQLRRMLREQHKARVEHGRQGGLARARNLSGEELSEIGRKAGKVGGKARAEKLSAEKRREIAKAAAAARWGAK